MKKKVIVYGLGQEFQNYQQLIFEMFDVVACTDSNMTFEKSKDIRYILPEDIGKISFDKILICTRKFQDAIKVRLLKNNISIEKIVCLDCLEKEETQTNLKKVISDMEMYQRINTDDKFIIKEDSLQLISDDEKKNAGTFNSHYFAQDIWGGNKIFISSPQYHYDIGSRLDGFIAHLLTFREVYYIDIRELPYEIPGLHFVRGDATTLEGIKDESIESLSCFHALEHFGLGRYGDNVEPDAYKKAAQNMQRVLKRKGHLYIGVPVGPEDKLIFNAHRIFTISTVLTLFDKMLLQDIAIVEPRGVYAKQLKRQEFKDIEEYSCGLFEFVKN